MASHTQQENCPNCLKLINVTYDSHDGRYLVCMYCGCYSRQIETQLTLAELNDLRAEFNDHGMVDEEDQLPPLNQLPEWRL